MTIADAAERAARLSLEGFDAFNTAFRSITRRARQRFENRDWGGARKDAEERLDAYDDALAGVALHLEQQLGDRARDQSVWVAAKPCFVSLVTSRYDIDRAETFFNSVTRKMLGTVGINRSVEFFYLHSRTAPLPDNEPVYRQYANAADTKELVRSILADVSFGVDFEDITRDAELAAHEIDLFLWPIVRTDTAYVVHIVNAVFYRNKGAFIVGRIVAGPRTVPLIIPLFNGPSGIFVDTILMEESEVSILLSFAYSYFFVDVERYDALMEFLRSITPHADVSGLYTALGYNRHGKTEFYRDLHRFVHVLKEQFVIAPGLEGAVMIVFTLPNYDFVFKVIKDRPCFLRSLSETPKVTTKEQVRRQYDFVSHRDHAGRMVDTQEFENLRFKRKRFSDQLIREFEMAGTSHVSVTDQYVVIRHVYVQRRVIPLPMYFQQEKDPESIRHVLMDFGYFLKDIARSGVFPTDLFNVWNYGVTNWGRVVLYDYDDVVPIEQVTFRIKPSPRFEFEETEPEEEWICVTGEDFFMDEIERYSGIPRPLRGVFKSIHGDLYTLKFWNRLMEQVKSGEVFDVIPYDRGKRFRTQERVT